MQIGIIAEVGGLLLIAAVSVRAAISIYSIAGRRAHANRQDREYIQLFEFLSSSILKKFEAEREKPELSWTGKRKFRVVRRQYEDYNNDICSFFLAPYDHRPLPPYRPGQFLTFELPIAGQPQPVVRCYSLSDSPTVNQQYYRISIKRLAPPPHAPPGTPPGLSSNYFHDNLREGDIVEVLAPSGEFCIDQQSERPVVLIAGGVGLTPLISMLNALAASRSKREIWFFYGVRNRGDHAMYDHLQRVRRQNPNVRTVIFYGDPTSKCRKGIDYDVEGFVSVELIKSLLKARNYKFYVCGPPPMMELVTTGLEEWGVPADDIMFEAFGPASLKKTAKLEDAAGESDDAGRQEPAKIFKVVFARSKKTVQWTKSMGTLLDLAEANGVKARCGCRAGNCGTCVTPLRQGEVDYVHKPGKDPEPGYCLPCIALPKSDLVIDI
ncbi:flavohemoprotein [bacterium MnTg02]|nr:flavohemoprotein [bacterium MnTg02]